jgi:putative ABC transport system substrate-binding protein
MKRIAMRRRDFITLLGGAAAAWPRAARAQQPATPVIGYIDSGLAGQNPELLTSFHKGLGETGFVVGRNVAIEHRWAENQYSRFPALAADLVRRRVAVIITNPPNRAVEAAKAATSTIPILFTAGTDPVQNGLVASLNRPGGNVTGVLDIGAQLGTKRLGLLHELVPTASTVAYLYNRNLGPQQPVEMQAAARTLGKQLPLLTAGTEGELDEAFAAAVRQKAGAIVIASQIYFFQRRVQLAVLAARHAMPMMSAYREITAAGGLMSYATSIPDIQRQLGVYAGRILKGEKAADLPVMQPTKFDLVINLRTAKALGLDIPPGVLAIADEVIE